MSHDLLRNTDAEFRGFSKIPRLMRNISITEKIDGENAQVHVLEDLTVRAGSRSRYITPEDDNHGFAAWVKEHEDELRGLGPGRHFGEWWGYKIKRGYGLPKGERRFSLFNRKRWADDAARPACCHVVPEIYAGPLDFVEIVTAVSSLRAYGSMAAPGFPRPEGIVIYHTASGYLFKRTLERDEEPKGR